MAFGQPSNPNVFFLGALALSPTNVPEGMDTRGVGQRHSNSFNGALYKALNITPCTYLQPSVARLSQPQELPTK